MICEKVFNGIVNHFYRSPFKQFWKNITSFVLCLNVNLIMIHSIFNSLNWLSKSFGRLRFYIDEKIISFITSDRHQVFTWNLHPIPKIIYILVIRSSLNLSKRKFSILVGMNEILQMSDSIFITLVRWPFLPNEWYSKISALV